MATTTLPQVHLCSFDSLFNTASQYFCYTNEYCCPTGCCRTYSYKYFQSWYFWISMIIFFIIYYGISWYCREMQKRRQMQIDLANYRNTHSDWNSPRNQAPDENVENILEQLFDNYRRRNEGSPVLNLVPKNEVSDPPPVYQEAINMPKPETQNSSQIVDSCLNEDEEPVPSYDFATRNENQ